MKSFSRDKKLLIAGPCSAETEEQVMQTGLRLKATGHVDLYRAGIWKPRTRPDSFEGVGADGLPWMTTMRDATGLPLTVEVAKASHVELCLKHSIDVLWIGARTTVNPFAVQEIADSLQGVEIPVMVKNPINPDFALWLGGIERLEKAGIKEIAAIHRGFSNLSETYYRNRPQWQLALKFHAERPDIPIICDPSHMGGRRDVLLELSQKAMNLAYDGLMIESHINPDEAWSDARQQITPETYGELIDALIIREDHEDDQPLQIELDELRERIDQIDDELLHLLHNRMSVAREIGAYKKQHNITILQKKRWAQILGRYLDQAEDRKLSKEFMENYLAAIHDESIDQQQRVIN